MNETLCPTCGNRNPPNTQFCNFCNAYLGWADERQPVPPTHGYPPGVDRRVPIGGPGPGPDEGGWPPGWRGGPPIDDRTRPVPVIPRPDPTGGGADPDTELRAEVEQQDVVVITPGAEPGAVPVHITNTSTVVEAYRVTTVNAPPWLTVTPGQARLLPGTDERVQVRLAIAADKLVPVQRLRVLLRVQGESSQRLYRDVWVDAAVGPVVAPVQVRLEPSSVRIKDSTTAQLGVLLDNRRSNVPKTFTLSGRDPEQEVRFGFQSVRVDVPPGGGAAVGLRVEAPLPPPGEQVNRTLTVVAVSGDEEVTANAAFTQAASAIVVDPPIGLRLDPTVVRADRRSGLTHVVLDNRRGTRPQRIHLEARDVEGVVRFTLVPQDLEVPAGQYAMARLSMQAPRPDPGESATRSLVVTAWNGRDSVEAQAQLVQETAERKPFLRVLLTLAGSLAMIVGSFLLWTLDPEGTGLQWNHPSLPQFFGVDTSPVDDVLSQLGMLDLVSAVVSLGSIVIFCAVLAALGIFSPSGKLIRSSAVFSAIVLVTFLLALVAGQVLGLGFPGLAGGWLIALAGSALAFVGSFFPRP